MIISNQSVFAASDWLDPSHSDTSLYSFNDGYHINEDCHEAINNVGDIVQQPPDI